MSELGEWGEEASRDGELGCPHSRLAPGPDGDRSGSVCNPLRRLVMSVQQEQQLYFLGCSRVRQIGPDTPSQVVYPPLSHLHGSPRLLDLF